MQTDSGPGGTYARIEDRGHRLASAREELQARMPTPEEQKLLRLDPGVPVVALIRTAYDSDGKAVEVFDGVAAAGQARLRLRRDDDLAFIVTHEVLWKSS